jgi:hypothetical protein
MRSPETTLEVVVEDIGDATLVADIRNVVHRAFREAAMTGTWTVALAESETRGRWDLALRGPQGRHFLSFAASRAAVPDVAGRQLARALERYAASRGKF